jgi:hypothetical protein
VLEVAQSSRGTFSLKTEGPRQTVTAMDAPETQYVTVGDADIAYQVIGEGETDLLYCYGLGSHIEMFGTYPRLRNTSAASHPSADLSSSIAAVPALPTAFPATPSQLGRKRVRT